MLQKVKKQAASRLFDVASGPMLLTLIGIPLLLVAVVILIAVITLRLIRKADQKRHPGDPDDD